jgi:hypothetical protein
VAILTISKSFYYLYLIMQAVQIHFLFLALIISFNSNAQTYEKQYKTNNQTTKWENKVLNDPDLYNKEYKDSLEKYNFTPLWTQTDNSLVYGFIGSNYQRIRIKIISASKSKTNPDVYTISGKSMVKNNISRFTGTINIVTARIYKNMHWGIDEEYKDSGIRKEGVIIAKYRFAEDSSEKYSGIFYGILSTSWYINKNGQLKYDNIENYSDGYCNDQFVGTWKGYKTSTKKICNWGDFRIPFSGALDVGAGEFSPNNTYLKFGWQIFHDSFLKQQPDMIARQEEEKEWWK